MTAMLLNAQISLKLDNLCMKSQTSRYECCLQKRLNFIARLTLIFKNSQYSAIRVKGWKNPDCKRDKTFSLPCGRP